MPDIVDHRYRIEQKLAVGGFGTIYRATDTTINRQVALKVLHRELAGDANVVARFRRETAALAKLRSPHTLTLYDVGTVDDTLYFVMELLRGESLFDVFTRTGPLSWRRIAHIARGVCASLREAHALGIVHRDLKPANIFLETHALDVDFAKVLDFGIAKIVAPAVPQISERSDLDDRDLTRHGQMIGTFDYMAPEQMVGGACTNKSDLFTLGVVIYEMLTGSRPYGDAVGPAQMLMALMTRTPTPLTGVPPELARIVMKCLSREPHDRPDVDQLDMVLENVLAVDEASFGDDAEETTMIAAKAPRPSRPSSRAFTEPGSAAPVRATPRMLPLGGPALQSDDSRKAMPSVMVSREALSPSLPSIAPAPPRRTPQGTPIVGLPHAAPVAGSHAAPVARSYAAPVAGSHAAPVARSYAAPVAAPHAAPVARSHAAPVAAPHAATMFDARIDAALAARLALAETVDLHSKQPTLIARGSDVGMARPVRPDLAARMSESAIERDIELALAHAATVDATAFCNPDEAETNDAHRSLTRMERDVELAVRFAPPRTRIASGTSPIVNEKETEKAEKAPKMNVELARKAVVLPPGPEHGAVTFIRYTVIVLCLFGLGFLGALTLWSLEL